MGLKRDYFRNILLTIFVIASFVLSYILWTAGRNLGAEEAATGRSGRFSVAQTSHEVSDAFRPTGIALHGADEENQILYAVSYPLRHLLRDMYATQTLEEIERSSIWTLQEYANQLQVGRWLEFVYNEEQPIGLLEQKFSNLSSDFRNLFFNRIIVDLDAPDTVYFYHTDSEWVYEASFEEDAVFDSDPFLNRENLDYHGAFSLVLDENIAYLPYEAPELPYRSFVIDQFPIGVYIENFFPDTSQVDRRSQNGIIRYIDLTKEVTINQNDNTLTYLRQISDTGELEPTTRFKRSFEQINRFENWSDTFVLSNYNRDRQIVEFHREIEGYPVFDPLGHEAISEVGLVESGVTHLKLPIRYINTPLTIQGEPAETLVSGAELINQLQIALAGRSLQEIQNISIGYSWLESDEDSQVIYFNPTWYIQMNDRWQSLADLLPNNLEGDSNGF